MREPLPDWPNFGMAEDVRPVLRRARVTRTPMVLATLAAVIGGGPRPPGTQMVFGEGFVAGYFSGGCVESDVADHAFACLADGEPRRLVYGEGSPWPDIRLLCGARIEIFLERIAPDDEVLGALLAAAEARRPAIWVSDGRRRQLAQSASDAWDGAVVRTYYPTPRLVIFGSDPTALAMASLGVLAGFETTLVRPKGPLEPPPICGVAYRRDEPAAALAALAPDPWTAIAVATHDLEIDQAALRAALPSLAGYVGLLGARARLPERLERLRAAGVAPPALERLHAPIGLDIGGKAPWEVAVSVIGEIIAGRRTENDSGHSQPTRNLAAPALP